MTYRKNFQHLLEGATLPDNSTTQVYGLSIPNKAAGFIAKEPINNEMEAPGLGTTIEYVDTNGISTVTVYVYNKGLAHIPDGISQVLREEAGRADRDIRAMWPLAVPWLNAVEGEIHDAPYISYGYKFPNPKDNKRTSVSYLKLMAHKNHFIKVRITRGDFASIYMSEGGALMVLQRIEDFMAQLAVSLMDS